MKFAMIRILKKKRIVNRVNKMKIIFILVSDMYPDLCYSNSLGKKIPKKKIVFFTMESVNVLRLELRRVRFMEFIKNFKLCLNNCTSEKLTLKSDVRKVQNIRSHSYKHFNDCLHMCKYLYSTNKV